jgi:Ca-activated chloride channel homolog
LSALATAFGDLLTLLRATLAEADALRLQELRFVRGDTARLIVLALLGVAAAALVARSIAGRRPERGRLALPAILDWMRASRWAVLRHGALLVALAGLLCLAVALADPVTTLVRRETTYPGRRISLMIDASSSMLSSLPSSRLAARTAPNDAAFFTTVGAAKYFVELRMKSQHRDLMALVEFGDQAYVITPFTTDYENILLSISLIGDWNEFMTFPDQGTIIASAIEQSVALFKAFNFLDAVGNAMVMFTDGVDAEVTEEGRSAFDVLRDAQVARVPVYFIRVGGSREARQAVSDEAWRAAVARTGGRFYAAADEATIVRALHEIDREAQGRISMRQYSTEQPRFAPFALAAVGLWSLAVLLRLTVPHFQKFP